MVIRELITNLGFDIDFGPLEKFDDQVAETRAGLETMSAAADQAVEQVKSALTGIRNVLLGFSVATAAAGAGLFALVKSAANVGDEINKTAPLLGFSVEEFQKYRYAAKLAGVENENFAGSIQLLLRNISEANNGNKEMAKSFARAGLTASQLKGLSSDQILRKLSDGLSKIPDQAKRVAVSMDLLGRSGARMGMFLSKGTAQMDAIMGDVEAFGMFTAESAQQAEDFNDALDRVLFFFGSIKNELKGFFPVFTGILNDFREWLDLHREIIKAGLAKGIEFLSSKIQTAWDWIKKMVQVFEDVIEAVGGVKNAFALLAVAAAGLFLPLIGPIFLIVKGLGYMLIPFLRLHTLISLVTFAMGAMMPLWTLLIGVVAALAATKIVGFLIQLAGGYRAIAAAMLVPTLEWLAQAAALGLMILFFEDLIEWMLGNKSMLGEWIGEWAKVPEKFRKLWEEIKDVFRSGGEFIAAVFHGDFKKAFDILNNATLNPLRVGAAAGQALANRRAMPRDGYGPGNGLPYASPAFQPGMGGWAGMPGATFAGAPEGYHRAGGPGHWNFSRPIGTIGEAMGRDDKAQAAIGRGVTQRIEKVDVNVNLPPGTPQDHAEQTAHIFKNLMDQQIDHSLQQSIPPGG